jgi:hypothetical protein
LGKTEVGGCLRRPLLLYGRRSAALRLASGALGETGRLINDFLTPRARTGAATAVIIPAFGVRLCGGSFGMAQRRRRPLRRGISEGVVIRVLGGV